MCACIYMYIVYVTAATNCPMSAVCVTGWTGCVCTAASRIGTTDCFSDITGVAMTT